MRCSTIYSIDPESCNRTTVAPRKERHQQFIAVPKIILWVLSVKHGVCCSYSVSLW
jgi:hypothetical protein